MTLLAVRAPDPTHAEDAFWRALANPGRRRVLYLLRDGPCTTGDLAGAFAALDLHLEREGTMDDARRMETPRVVRHESE